MSESADQSLRISEIELFRATSPNSRPIADSTHQIDEISFLITRIRLGNGIIGESYLLAFDYSPQSIAGVLRDVREFALGYPVTDTGRFLIDYERETEYFGTTGIHRWGQAAINIAMWDAWAKYLGQPVHNLFGVVHKRLPVYGSGGWLSYSNEELLEEVDSYLKRGFKAVKIKVGSQDIERDVERLSKVRECTGSGISIMMDANQGMDVASASTLAEKVRSLEITWFEEPINHRDFDGYRILRERSRLSIAMGEREFDLVALRELTARKAIDLWQPDIFRLGSVEAWRASASFAAAHRIPVLPHYYKEYDVPLLATIPNARGAESFDWVDPLISHPMHIDNGYAYLSERPGWGFTFKDQFLKSIL